MRLGGEGSADPDAIEVSPDMPSSAPQSDPGSERQSHGRRHGRRHERRRRILAAALLAVAVLVALEAIPGVPGHPQAALLWEVAASDAGAVAGKALPFIGDHTTQPCARLEAEFEVGNHLLRNDAIGWYSSIWPSYQALNGLFVTSLSPGGQQCRSDFLANLEAIDANYWDSSYAPSPADFDQGPSAFHVHSDLPRVDDSLWMGLANMQGFEATGTRMFLLRAEAVFRLAVGNWDPAKGGVYWEEHLSGATNDDKSVVSNAPAVLLGAALFEATRRETYLAWSIRILRWLERNLADPATGLYGDHVDTRTTPPTVDRAVLTYDQGAMVTAIASVATVAGPATAGPATAAPTAAPAATASATGANPAERPTLSDAVALARRAMRFFAAHHSYGQPAFDAIWATDLLWTASRYHQAAFTDEARRAVSEAARSEHTASGSLLVEGSELALDQLTRLAPALWAKLLPLGSSPGRPGG